ncbi:MAG: TerC family protein [Alphaproteobacteria bacterium]|nr:TerC family protein [Alphaproteobacteria bacterium]
MDFMSYEFWAALGAIVYINILLSGDNAVVIALACRELPANQRKLGIFYGSLAAILLRIVFTFFVVELMKIPYLQIVGAALLLWIAVKLLVPEENEGGHGVKSGATLWAAVRTVAIADAVMSLDNVIAIAAAARGDLVLILIGLAISMPLIIYGSQLVLVLLQRYPFLITLGGAVLGYLAGEIGIADPVVKSWVDSDAAWLHWGAPWGLAVGVVLVARAILAARKARAKPEDLAAPPQGDKP